MIIDETALRQIIREEMKSVLKEVGLHDDDAGNDVRDLRSLITDWRGIEKHRLADCSAGRHSVCVRTPDAGCLV